MTALPIPADVRAVMECFDRAGYEVFCVGGCVRDYLRGIPPHDWDLCSSAKPEETLTLCRDYTCIPTGIQHGTVTVLTETRRPLEITTYRIDGTYTDHRRPDAVTFCTSLREDCARRDFTVNAMAYHPEKGLQDFFGGQSDLAAHVIRCVGEPEQRFSEDALRMLRALRFASVLGFSVEEKTAAALHAGRESLSAVARERITAELRKFLSGENVPALLDAYRDVFSVIFSKELLPGLADADFSPLVHAFSVLKSERTRMAAFLSVCSCKNPQKLLREMTCETSFCREVAVLTEEAEQPLLEDALSLKRRLRTCPSDLLSDAFALHGALIPGEQEAADHAQKLLSAVLASGVPTDIRSLAVNGSDLLSLGIRGKAVGETLSRLLDAVIEERLPNDREVLLDAITKMDL